MSRVFCGWGILQPRFRPSWHVAVVLIALAAACQQPSPNGAMEAASTEPSDTFRATVNEVNMYFSVMDGGGRPVTGLTRSDFTVADRQQSMPIAFFQSETDAPLRIVVAIDVSNSVAAEIKYELDVASRFLYQIKRPGDQARIVGFGTGVYEADDLSTASARLMEVVKDDPQMGTAMYDAIRTVCGKLTRSGVSSRDRSVLVLMTDGEDNASRTTPAEALHAVEEAGVTVFVVYTGQDHPSSFLHRVTKLSGGRLFDAVRTSDAAKALAKVTTILREQYLLAYHPSDLQPDGTFHQVDIVVERKHLKVFCRHGYYAARRSER